MQAAGGGEGLGGLAWVQWKEQDSLFKHEGRRRYRLMRSADELYDTLVSINKDENIPAQPTAGKWSKQEHAQQAEEEATRRIRDMVKQTGWVSGKWLWRVEKTPDVDMVWKAIAPSVVGGPLAKAGAYAAKVMLERTQYLFSVSIKDAYDKVTCTALLEALVSLYGIVPTGVKLDAYTCAGITSGHPSRIDTLVMRPKDIEGGWKTVQRWADQGFTRQLVEERGRKLMPKRLKAEFDQHEEIFGTGSRAMDVSELLVDADLDLEAIERADEEETIKIIKAPQTQAQASPASRKRKRGADGLEGGAAMTTPRRMPLITFEDGLETSTPPSSSNRSKSSRSAVSDILRSPNAPTSSVDLMRHFDYGFPTATSSRRSTVTSGMYRDAQQHAASKPLIQLSTNEQDQGRNCSQTSDLKKGGQRAQGESRLAKRSRMMMLR